MVDDNKSIIVVYDSINLVENTQIDETISNELWEKSDFRMWFLFQFEFYDKFSNRTLYVKGLAVS
jgi:hypothetical protein